MFSFIKNLLNKEKLDYTELIERDAMIIDVRTAQEFADGHADNSITVSYTHLTLPTICSV